MAFKIYPASLLLMAAFANNTACTSTSSPTTEQLGSARLALASGEPIGTARLSANGNQLSLAVSASGLEPGEHGFHLHQTGRCERPDFKSAGGHLNPLSKDHGLLSENGSHVGDLPNLQVKTNGSVSAIFPIPGSRDTIHDWVYDEDGTALIIHAKPDDYRTNPSGNAGQRIACGVLVKSGT